ncbi:hypothetical protein HOLleu_15297 [Holothuria leucospilota]|uniref:Uncharacterized protein n=1 Tax=Holothuria leucospilota TaxID=206669 RepID=A0A9Q1CA25_HOLLE|nr:hypothetical protein HOLleu_15297 [Holothuria leucospilota]
MKENEFELSSDSTCYSKWKGCGVLVLPGCGVSSSTPPALFQLAENVLALARAYPENNCMMAHPMKLSHSYISTSCCGNQFKAPTMRTQGFISLKDSIATWYKERERHQLFWEGNLPPPPPHSFPL